ncbi:hypothetical protein E2P81_ATG04176 [Venturia nashicola]|uniref:Uncharacterized protein n=1 Tax=Venturia nashicola TaxID=86259 RepID=A0A4Z1PHR8_9PEZI|nr:hypothetical protein E6O75_ATG04276 [Venturia nashicola]TLD37364.1 hypothetical protein E2P81_ATG04176 [Venturia nashicola]
MHFSTILALLFATALAAPAPQPQQRGPYDVGGAFGDLVSEGAHQAGHLTGDIVNGVAAVPKAAAGGLAGLMDVTTGIMKGTDNAFGWGNHGSQGRPGEERGQRAPPPSPDY